MKNLTIGKKLYFAFAAMVVLMFLIGGVSINRLEGLTQTFVSLQENYNPIADHAMETQIELLQVRRHEKDFISHRDPKYIERMDKSVKSLQNHVSELTDLASELDLAEIVKQSQTIGKDMDVYQASFNKVVKLINAQGDKDTGIRGAMRKEAHEMETAIKGIGSDSLMVNYLMMRRHEKDFILREDNKYVKRSRDIIGKIEGAMDYSLLMSEEGQNLMKHTKDYVAAFARLAQNVGEMKMEYPVMRKAAHEIEELTVKIEESVMEVIAGKEHEAVAQEKATILFLYVLCGFIILAGISLSIFSVRAITKP